MKKLSEEFCIFTGIFAIVYFFADTASDICKYYSQYFLHEILKIFAAVFSSISLVIQVYFVVLLVQYIFFHKELTTVEKLMRNYPKCSVYAYYLGEIWWILFAVNILSFLINYLFIQDIAITNIFVLTLIVANVLCIMSAFIIATYKVLHK